MPKKSKDAFLEGLKRRRERAASGASGEATTPEKPPEQMSGEELDVALLAAQRDLLDLRHQELRERELARIQKPTGEGAGQRTLADVLREKQRGKRRPW
jgi:hypothetical protein